MPRHTGPQPQVSDLPIMHQPFWLFPMKTLPLVVSASVEQGLLGPRKPQEATTPDTQAQPDRSGPSKPTHTVLDEANPMQDLHTLGLNPFAVTLLAESMLKSAYVKNCGTKPLTFEFPVRRGDCEGWAGVRITIEAVPAVGVGKGS